MNVVGYVRVSTLDQGENGSGLDAQESAIRSECERRGWNLIGVLTDVASGKSTKKRPSYAEAIRLCDSGEAEALVAAKIDRLSRSTLDFAQLLEGAQKGGWSVVVLDLGVDTSTPNGELIVSIIAAMAQWERRMISQRTKEALAEKKKQGVHVGRPRYMVVSDTIREQIILAHDAGMNNNQIAVILNREGITGPGGGRWHWPSVQRVIDQTLQTA